MKYIKHYLEGVRCPFNRDFSCDSRCALFDNVNEDCKLIGMGWKIRESLNELKDIMVFEKQKPIGEEPYDGYFDR